MKKLIALTACLCLLLCLFAGCGQSEVVPYEDEPETEAAVEDADTATDAAESAEETAEEPVEATEAPVSIGQGGTGYETYPADTVVATVNGTDVTWMEYFYWLNYYTSYIRQIAAQYDFVITDWDGYDLSADNTNADVVLMNAKQNIIQDHVIRFAADEMGVTLSDEDYAELEDVLAQNADSYVGDGDGEATEEELAAFDDYLQEQMHVDTEFFNNFNLVSLLSEAEFEAASGEMGENYPDEDVLAFAEDNGLMAAKHILLMTVDPDTLESLSDEEIAEKKALAEDLLARLQAVADDQDALIALFDELMMEYSEDTGVAYYPDGYVFAEGEMVEEFENAVKELEGDYAMSDIVESTYGYHIILRLPVNPDASIGTDANGNDVSLRYAAATQQFSATLTQWIDEAEVVWNDGFEYPDLAAIFG